MGTVFEYDRERDICTIRVRGEHKRSVDSKSLLRAAGDFGVRHGCSRFLFDMRAATIIGGIMDIYDTAVATEARDLKMKHRLAAVYSGNMADHKFMETVAVNRGYIFRTFNDCEDALSWLAADE